MKGTKVNTFRSMLAKFLVTLMVIMSVAVISPYEAKAAVTAPKLNKKECTIYVGKMYNLNVNNKVKDSTYQWSSSNTKVATVNARGFVKGESKGTAYIYCNVTAPKSNYKLICRVSVLNGASSFTITNKVSALNVGQVYDLNRKLTPATSNEKTVWTSSDTTIAAPDKLGKFTALKEGTVTITGTTASGKTDSVTIKVVDKDGTVTNQKDLSALLGSGAELITIKTTDTVNLEIPAGDYSNQKLVVDAPNAEITNSGLFASINIKQIKSNTWIEKAEGNKMDVSAPDVRIIVSPGAKISIEVSQSGASVKIENNGVVQELVVSKDAKIDISGTSKENVPIVINAPDIEITSSVPLDLDCTKKVDLVLLKGAEATTIHAATEDVIPSITGNVTINVKVGEGNTATEKTIVGAPIISGGSGASGSSGSTTPTAGTVTKDVNGSTITYTLSKPYTELSSIVVSYGTKTFSISSTTLSLLKGFLSSEQLTIALWKSTTDTTNTYDNQTVTVTGDKDSMTKTVSFTGGNLNNKTYTVTVNNNTVTVTSAQNGLTFTVSKGTDDKSLIISGPQLPSELTFTPYF